MFELLDWVRSEDHYPKLPFLVVQLTNLTMDAISKESAELLGAYEILELQGLPDDEGNKQLLTTVSQSFNKSVENERADK